MAKKLLLIEDSLSIQALVGSTFEHEDFDLIVTDNALDGLHKAQTISPDIVLADASMPDMDGFQLCHRIRQTTSGRYIPVILLTSGFAAYDKARGDLAGVTTHLVKPFAPHALIDLVKQYFPIVRRATSSLVTTAASLSGIARHPGKDAEPILETLAAGTPRLDIPQEEGSGEAEMAHTEPELTTASPEIVWQAASGPTAPAVPPGLAQRAPDAHAPETSRDSQPVALHEEPEHGPTQLFYQTLGRHIEQLVRDTLEASLPTLLAQLTPRLLDTARAVVAEKMPDILEVLLQQEIDKLKRAVEQGSDHA